MSSRGFSEGNPGRGGGGRGSYPAETSDRTNPSSAGSHQRGASQQNLYSEGQNEASRSSLPGGGQNNGHQGEHFGATGLPYREPTRRGRREHSNEGQRESSLSRGGGNPRNRLHHPESDRDVRSAVQKRRNANEGSLRSLLNQQQSKSQGETQYASTRSQKNDKKPSPHEPNLPKADYSGAKLLIPRPGLGKSGKQRILLTNHFALNVENNKSLHTYSLKFEPDPKSRREKRRVLELLIEFFKTRSSNRMTIASDYASILITPAIVTAYTDGSMTFPIPYYEKGESGPRPSSPLVYHVTLSHIKSLNLNHLTSYLQGANTSFDERAEVLTALNIVFGQRANENRSIQAIGQNRFFPLEKDPIYLGGGLDACKGYFKSVRAASGHPEPQRRMLLLNVNVATSPFFAAGPLVDVISDWRRTANRPRLIDLSRFLKGVRVMTNHVKAPNGTNGQTLVQIKTICEVAKVDETWNEEAPPTPARVKFFWDKKPTGPGTVSVAEYFRIAYPNRPLREPSALVVNVGAGNRPSYLPAELCTVILGTLARRQLEPGQTDTMVRAACREPREVVRDLEGSGLSTFIGSQQGNTNSAPQSFGLNVANKRMLKLQGRYLTYPQIYYGSFTPRLQDKKPTQWNLANGRLERPADRGLWSYVQFGLRDQGAPPLLSLIERMMREYRIRPNRHQNLDPEDHRFDFFSGDDRQRADRLTKLFQRTLSKRVALLFVFTDGRLSGFDYAMLKFFGDFYLGVQTIVVTSKVHGPGGAANVVLKYNLRMGGTNQRLGTLPLSLSPPAGARCDTMIVGVDVTHPGPGAMINAPSIAAVVASIDQHFAQFPASVRRQSGRVEMIENLKEMVLERLHAWKDSNGGNLPRKVIVYRDGVSEGEFDAVLRNEVPKLRAAFRALYPQNKLPKLVVITVQKRHHTRFYPCNPNGEVVGGGNPYPGLVVDTVVTLEHGFDWYCQSHAALQGTARPAHCVVLVNEPSWSADELQRMTHDLCFLFGRCTTSVSMPPAAYYAHLACERARNFLYKQYHPRSEDAGTDFNTLTQTWSSGVHVGLKGSMWYI